MASRLETSPRTQLYAEIIRDTVNLGACDGGYATADVPVPSAQMGDVVNAVHGYEGTIVQVSQPTPAAWSGVGRRQAPEPSVTATVAPTVEPSTVTLSGVPFVTTTAVMTTPTYGPSGSASVYGYSSCSNESRGKHISIFQRDAMEVDTAAYRSMGDHQSCSVVHCCNLGCCEWAHVFLVSSLYSRQ